MFTSKGFEKFRKETEAAMADIAEKYNVDIKGGHIKYDANSFTLVLEVNKKEVNGKPYEQMKFEENCKYYGLKPEDYKRQFKSNGDTFTIIGINPNARVRQITTLNSKGQTYNFTQKSVKEALA